MSAPAGPLAATSTFGALRTRIILILAAAVIPATLIVGTLAYQSFHLMRERASADILQDGELLTSRMNSVMVGASRIAAILAEAATWDSSFDAACADRLSLTIKRLTGYDGLGVARGDRVICSVSKTPGLDITPLVEKIPRGAISREQTWERLVEAGPARLAPVSVARSQDERSQTLALVAVDPAFLAELLKFYRSVPSSAAYIVDAARHVVAGAETNAIDLAQLNELPLPDEPQFLTVSDRQGKSWVVTSRKMERVNAWLVTTQSEADVFGPADRQFWLVAAAPVLIFIAAALGIWLGLANLVLRWIQRIDRAALSYARGNQAARIGPLRGAPAELAQLAANFDNLCDRIAERTSELETQVMQKQRFIRELHHRVKNNLQIIASLLALQKDALPEEARPIVRFSEDRVNALSAAYGVSYAETELGQVSVGALIKEVVQRFFQDSFLRAPEPVFTIGEDAGTLDLDTAVTISMLLAEFLPAMIDASAAAGAPIRIEVTPTAPALIISVRGPASPALPRSNLSARIVKAYVRQLSAALDETSPGAVRLEVPWPASRLADLRHVNVAGADGTGGG